METVLARGTVTIGERRAPWREDSGPEWSTAGIARLRHTAARGRWTLFWRNRNARWHRYDRIEPSRDITTLHPGDRQRSNLHLLGLKARQITSPSRVSSARNGGELGARLFPGTRA